jgi:hypothetical protein
MHLTVRAHAFDRTRVLHFGSYVTIGGGSENSASGTCVSWRCNRLDGLTRRAGLLKSRANLACAAVLPVWNMSTCASLSIASRRMFALYAAACDAVRAFDGACVLHFGSYATIGGGEGNSAARLCVSFRGTASQWVFRALLVPWRVNSARVLQPGSTTVGGGKQNEAAA